MVIDTSVIVAIIEAEPEAPHFTNLIEGADPLLMSGVTRVECTCVLEGRKQAVGRAALEGLISRAAISILPVNQQQVDLACEAFRRFGKGRHPAALNIGDCFAYALAKASGEPLLFKGDDFGRTDVAVAA